jgi:amidase
MRDLEALDAVATAQSVRIGEVSPREAVDAAFVRLQERNGAINAVIDSWQDEAQEQAAVAPKHGLLAGVPLLLKDTVEYPGKRFAMGSRLRMQVKGQTIDPWVSAMQAEGAICIGKTNTPEFGLMDVTEPLAFGPTLNPWHHDLVSGGSSGGSAAAVAARITPAAHGSDGGGSIRYPAACCGVFGLKPTRGRTAKPKPGFDERLPSLVSTHVLTNSVRDSALFFAIAECALLNVPGAAAGRWVQQPLTQRLKVAVIDRPLHGGALASVHDEALQQTVKLMRELGHDVIHCDWPFDAPALHSAFFDRWAYTVHADFAAQPDAERRKILEGVEPWTRGLARMGAALDTGRVESMVQICLHATVLMEQFHQKWDVLLTPVCAEYPVTVGSHAPDVSFDALYDRVARSVAFTPLQNITGQPAMSVPLTWTHEQLPVGVHFASGAHRDELLFQLAYQLEAAQPWAQRRPPNC